jgi:negative regulator of sigma E activity
MTEQLRQSLSAVIDEEADAFELRRVLDELDRDGELRATWGRYHLIGSVIRGERTARSRSAARVLADRVPLAVRDSTVIATDETGETDATDATHAPVATSDPAPGSEQRVAATSSRRRATIGLGLAAGLVLTVALAYQTYEDRGEGAGTTIEVAQGGMSVASAPTAAAPAAEGPRAVGPGWIPEIPAGRSREAALAGRPVADRRAREASTADLRRAQAYMLQHAQQQGLEQRGVMSLVKVATYEAP